MIEIIAKRIKQAVSYAKVHGVFATARKIRDIYGERNNLFGRKCVVSAYEWTLKPEFGSANQEIKCADNSINWFIPPVGKGSGGHLNIFRFIKNLEALGYECNIVVVGSFECTNADSLKKNIEDWFFSLNAKVFINENVPKSKFAIATSWQTAYWVKRFRDCDYKCYFVQDFEPWFYPSGTDSILAENTYKFGFYGITAGNWLAGKLEREYAMQCCPVGFSFDRNLYKPQLKRVGKSKVKRVFFYARPPTARRAFELGLMVLNEVCKANESVEVVFAGWDLSEYHIPFRHVQAGLVSLDKLADLYSSCDVGLVLSLSNVSLLPIELMACRVPVVSNKAGYTEWLLDANVCMLVEPDVDSLKSAILEVLDDDELANRLMDNGESFAKNTSWEKEAVKFSSILDSIL